jgi:hypothetical protein
MIGDALREMLSGANLQLDFWPYAFYHYIWIYNFLSHCDRPSSPYEMCGAPLPNLAKLWRFGCRIYVRPTTSCYGCVIQNFRLGVFLGYLHSQNIMYYFDLGRSTVIMDGLHLVFATPMRYQLSLSPPWGSTILGVTQWILLQLLRSNMILDSLETFCRLRFWLLWF